MNLYLAQFKRGYAYTSVYLLRDRTDEDGNQTFGFFRPDYTPRKAAVYLHNLTTILADKGSRTEPGQLDFSIPDQTATVHDLLLRRSDGTFQLVLWGERLKGEDRVTVRLAVPQPSVTIYDPTIGVVTCPDADQCRFDRSDTDRPSHDYCDSAREAMRPTASIADTRDVQYGIEKRINIDSGQ